MLCLPAARRSYSLKHCELLTAPGNAIATCSASCLSSHVNKLSLQITGAGMSGVLWQEVNISGTVGTVRALYQPAENRYGITL